MPPQLSEAWDQQDVWSGLASAKERRRLQNRLHQRAYRKKRHQKRLAMNQESMAADTHTTNVQISGSQSNQLIPCQMLDSTIINAFNGAIQLLQIANRPKLRDAVFKFLHDASASWSLNLVRPQDLPGVTRLNTFDALARNAMLLEIPFEFLETDDFSSIFNYHGPVIEKSFPDCLNPTALQMAITHHSWLDLLPLPGLRDSILRGIEHGGIDEEELCEDMCCDLLNLEAETVSSILIWGDSWDARGWEFSPHFLDKWGFLFQKCPEILHTTNYWRERRGAMKIDFLLN